MKKWTYCVWYDAAVRKIRLHWPLIRSHPLFWHVQVSKEIIAKLTEISFRWIINDGHGIGKIITRSQVQNQMIVNKTLLKLQASKKYLLNNCDLWNTTWVFFLWTYTFSAVFHFWNEKQKRFLVLFIWNYDFHEKNNTPAMHFTEHWIFSQR